MRSLRRYVSPKALRRHWKIVLPVVLVILMGGTAVALLSVQQSHSACTKAAPSSTSAQSKDTQLLPVTGGYSAPAVDPINNPSSMSSQDIQSQPNQTPQTESPQPAAAPSDPTVINTPVVTDQTPVTNGCKPCGGVDDSGPTRAAVHACPMYCVK